MVSPYFEWETILSKGGEKTKFTVTIICIWHRFSVFGWKHSVTQKEVADQSSNNKVKQEINLVARQTIMLL